MGSIESNPIITARRAVEYLEIVVQPGANETTGNAVIRRILEHSEKQAAIFQQNL